MSDEQELPAGIWHEPDRNQYRVRVRRKERIVHQTRHPATKQGLEQAMESLRVGKQRRARIRKGENSIGTSDADRARALADGTL